MNPGCSSHLTSAREASSSRTRAKNSMPTPEDATLGFDPRSERRATPHGRAGAKNAATWHAVTSSCEEPRQDDGVHAQADQKDWCSQERVSRIGRSTKRDQELGPECHRAQPLAREEHEVNVCGQRGDLR